MEILTSVCVIVAFGACWKAIELASRVALLEREIEDTWVWIGHLEEELSELRQPTRLDGDEWKDI